MSKTPQLYRFTVGDPETVGDLDDDGYHVDVVAFSIEAALSEFREHYNDEPSRIDCEGDVEIHDDVLESQ